MVQDITPKKYCNQFKNKEPDNESRIIVFADDKLLLKYNTEIEYIRYADIADDIGDAIKNRFIYLFSIDEEEYFGALLLNVEENGFLKEKRREGFELYSMTQIRKMAPKDMVFAALTAFHLCTWYRDNRFCGRCGKSLEHDEKERMMKCTHCSNKVYPKISPAVIVGVTNGDKILMSKYKGRAYKNYALIAGFTEIGETVEQTVEREVFEEVGIRVKNITYYKSQPWGMASDILLGYFCELDGSDELTVDEEELSLAQWIDFRDIPDNLEDLSLTNEMMLYFKKTKIDLNSQRACIME